ncbi:MAG: precorrin-3B C(17)-methyltransferase [Magnetovibrio sp.]|nr:precorrin-3B C(17)-methyltransferase [Magnetovibrio sp.]
MTAPVFIAITPAGHKLASKLAKTIPNAMVHGLENRTEGGNKTFSNTKKHLQYLFIIGKPIIGVCAAGILIRALAPLISDKKKEPPVLAMSEDGLTVIPLLGGHNGANRIARELAAKLNIKPAITTAGDLSLGFALDEPPSGWKSSNPNMAKNIAASLLAGEAVGLKIESGDATWLQNSNVSFSKKASPSISVTHKVQADTINNLALHPPVMALGIGCERGCEPEELISLAEKTIATAKLASESIACVASLDIKADEIAIHALANHFAVPARFFTVDELEAETPRLANPSDIVFDEVGCHGVAEAAALAVVGQNGELVVPKKKSTRATCALSLSQQGIDPYNVGKKQGRLTVVGIGPGDSGWRTPYVTQALTDADLVVGYDLYLNLIKDVIVNKPTQTSILTEEEARVRLALDRAADGSHVALVSSGDAGIYALAALTFELLDHENNPSWNRLEIRVEPGISAIQAVAARAGAPIGHDFCTISLSDLLTPWEVIKKRLAAAADGDFICALYNPVSKRRRRLLVVARETMLMYRAPETPVILGRNLGREGEAIDVIRLDELEPSRADMLTLVLIGNSQTRLIKRGINSWIYAPRGYAKKMDTSNNRL